MSLSVRHLPFLALVLSTTAFGEDPAPAPVSEALAVAADLAPSAPACPTLYTEIAGPELLEIVRSLDIEPDVHEIREGAPYLTFTTNNFKMVIFTFDCDDDSCSWIQMYAGFATKKKPKAKVVNAYNQNWRSGRAYVDAEGDAVYERDLDLSGGVTRQTIVNWLEDFRQAVPNFADTIVPSK
jgi:Putative bacterial sensory transduction regulator